MKYLNFDKNTFNYQDLADYVYAFNSISGQRTKTEFSDVVNQIKLIEEETTELCEARDANDYVEILDACVDILYVTIGLMQKLENKGVDVKGAMHRVCKDNHLKFPVSVENAMATLEYYHKQDVEVEVHYNDEYNVFIVKDENNKVRKPVFFTRTTLAEFVPDELKGEGNASN